MNDIRIFMCCHRQYETIPPLCGPIQCGTSLNPVIDGILWDNEGDNISDKNRAYCELTAHYYAWKNIRADYYGFCHYRRFFCAEDATKPAYLAKGTLTEKQRTKLLRDEQYWRGLITAHDIVVPKAEDMGIPARQHYITSRFHYEEDLALFTEILRSREPLLIGAAEEYLSQGRQYFCNMFVMKAQLFGEYCAMLFGILEEFDKRKSLHGDFQSDRTDGYLGEIFTGIFITHCRKNGADICEVPRLDVGCTFKKRLGCAVLPPESRRRFAVKKLVKKLRSK